MFIELVDALRCVEPHEDSWLVLATRRMAGRTVVDGTLGCPVCRRSYPIADGVAYFGAAPDGSAGTGTRGSVGAAPPPPPPPPPSEEDVLRLAAMLGLASPGGVVVLAGDWARYADALLELAPTVRLLLLDPTAAGRMGGEWIAPDGSVSVVRTAGGGDVVPLAVGSVRAAALDGVGAANGARIADVARVLAAGGRLVGPTGVALPSGVRELARDDALWVAEREQGVGAPVPIGRRARRE